MILLQNITLTQFRNYPFKHVDFSEKIIAVCGRNGAGKTNLLDAVYYLCFTKSYFSKPDGQSVSNKLKGFRIEGNFLKDKTPLNEVCILRENNRKEFLQNNEPYKKFSEHIGKLPCVMIAPDDVQLISEGSETRRNFIDTVLSQINPAYLQQLITYKKILEQRNSFLKAVAERSYTDFTVLDILDKQLVNSGDKIYADRKIFLEQLLKTVLEEYKAIAQNEDGIDLKYYSQLHNVSFKSLLDQNRQRDLYLQRTGCGVHKDDLEITMNGMPFKTIASQGQRKSILFALKLAEYRMLKEKKQTTPLLLLDDIFEKLDAYRMNNLLYRVCIEEEGQVIITDTHKQRLQDAFKHIKVNFQLIDLDDKSEN